MSVANIMADLMQAEGVVILAEAGHDRETIHGTLSAEGTVTAFAAAGGSLLVELMQGAPMTADVVRACVQGALVAAGVLVAS